VTERAINLNLLESTTASSAVTFVHALTREALYNGVMPLRRRNWHRHIADVLTETADPPPDTVAYHFQRAGDPRAIEWLVRAGMRARSQSAWISAADRYASAAELLVEDRQQIRVRGWLLFYVGYLLRFTVGEKSVKYHQEAEQAALAAGDELLAAYALYSLGSTRAIRPTPEMRAGLIELRRGVQAIEHFSGRHRWRSTDEQALAMIQALLVPSDSNNWLETETPERSRQPVLVPQRGVLISRLAQAGYFLESLQLGGTS
jgi:hypothetical protein